MENAKRKRGRPPKQKVMEFEGMTYEGAINNALDQEVKSELDDTLAHKPTDELSDDERKYLKGQREGKVRTLNIRFTESEYQDIESKCEQFGYKSKSTYVRDCVRARVDIGVDRADFAETNRQISSPKSCQEQTQTAHSSGLCLTMCVREIPSMWRASAVWGVLQRTC